MKTREQRNAGDAGQSIGQAEAAGQSEPPASREYVRNCLFKAKPGEEHVLLRLAYGHIVQLDGYAIVPREEYEQLTAAGSPGADPSRLRARLLEDVKFLEDGVFWLVPVSSPECGAARKRVREIADRLREAVAALALQE